MIDIHTIGKDYTVINKRNGVSATVSVVFYKDILRNIKPYSITQPIDQYVIYVCEQIKPTKPYHWHTNYSETINLEHLIKETLQNNKQLLIIQDLYTD
ncbi:hypothetical protein Deiofobo_0061 [Pseudomonas phage Deifobo]|nr:hypothetical protein Deiofobo_0061 [Pseudomonas phage Deifobo]